MMSRYSPKWLIVIGIAGLIIGVALPMLMIVQVLETTWLLNFIAYVASFGGLSVGMVGVIMHWHETNDDERDDWWRR